MNVTYAMEGAFGMKYRQWLTVVVAMNCIILSTSCSKKEETGSADRPKTVARVVSDGIYGWDSLVLRNQFIRFDVVPSLGGKIMGYGLHGFQVLWHDAAREGEVVTDQGYGFGEKFFNPGGAKVWPAPQGWSGPGEWPGPPDNVLDSAPYDSDATDKSIIVTSPEDNGEGRTGLQFSHEYSLIPFSSSAQLALSMENVVDRQVRWSLWHIATLPVDRRCTVYAPVDDGGWHVIFGEKDNPQWLGVEDGLFRARYDRRVGKVGLKAREGWVAWHDEENNIVFAVLFPVEKGKEYPDGGSNIELWTTGAGSIHANNSDVQYEYSPETAMMEIEVLGPLTSLSPGASASMDVVWGVTRCSGVKRVTPSCVVVEELTFDKTEGIHGRFGVFYSGNLQTIYLGDDDEILSVNYLSSVSPISEVIIDQPLDKIITWRAKSIRFQIRSGTTDDIHVIGEVRLPKR